MFYNIGVQNNEVVHPHWLRRRQPAQDIHKLSKYDKLAQDIYNVFTNECSIQMLLISEFGEMLKCIDEVLMREHGGVPQHTAQYPHTKAIFEALLADLKLPHIYVEADPPYVALIDGRVWSTSKCEAMYNRCTKPEHFVQHLVLQHVESIASIRILNAHIPTSKSRASRRRCIEHMCAVATYAMPWMPWMIGGDCNVDVYTMHACCQPYIVPGVHCISESQWQRNHDAQKADHALCQGIALNPIQSWVGIHSEPCVADIHDAVVMKGVLQETSSETWLPGDLDKPVTDPGLLPVAASPTTKPAMATRPQPTVARPIRNITDPPAMACSGDPHPAAQTQNNSGNGDDRKDSEIAIQQQLLNEGGIGCEMIMGEHAVQAVAEHAGHHVLQDIATMLSG
jgi:hypothetical protein